MDFFVKAVQAVHGIVWGVPTVAFLLFCGIYFSLRLNFFQLFRFRRVLGDTVFAKNKSGWGAAWSALAATLGIGNIVGVATAITAGGAGAIFWMWVSALFGMATHYVEIVLGMLWRKKEKNATHGGPMYFMLYGMKSRRLAECFCALCVLASFGVGNMVQINSIADVLDGAANVPKAATSAVAAVIVAFVMTGGFSRLEAFCSRAVPFAAVGYMACATAVIIANYKSVPAAFGEIFEGAFSARAAAGGAIGYGFVSAVKFGVARGIFGNEAGMGSSVIAHASSDEKSPVVQGFWGVFEVFFDTIVVCTLSALAILCAADRDAYGVAMVTSAFTSVFKGFGGIIVAAAVVLFSLSSILGWSFFGLRAVAFFGSKRLSAIYCILFVAAVFFGGMFELEAVWLLSDIFNGLMSFPNLIACLALFNSVKRTTDEYFDNIKQPQR